LFFWIIFDLCRTRGKVVYPLDEVLLLCLLAVLAGADSFVEIARFGTKKRALLRRFRPFAEGPPSHDHLGDIFAALDAEKFQQCFVAWVASLAGAPAGVIAIDGKTVRRSRSGKGQDSGHPYGLRGAPTPRARPGQGGGHVE
jgi:DDE_Tnp_1-associated